ncbi:MAG: asparagine synthase (glutamine-hydrolyzing) [Nitrospira sp.]|jgi:asparagine synthase (glutamine-hydrolysing)|nr:asparagine synthase (glutamine-hydrolyzing) [Nitrospira sp.]
MCGIVGVVSSAPVERKHIEVMRDSMIHRGPDAAGIWLSPDALVCLGHRRLAIVDLSPEANQPFVSGDGRYIVTFNGEIYNYRSVREELTGRGVDFRTTSDTEVLIEAFRYWGQQCVDKLSGMFAFAIWDRTERQLFCARDRVGEKPFYYAVLDGCFIFSSELKALTQWPGFRKRIHYPALVDFLTFGFVADPKSIWEGCYKLPPGHCMTAGFRSGTVTLVQAPAAYWDVEYAPDHSVARWEPKILETLQSASKEMTISDVPLGAFLSGGVDSSSVIAALGKAGTCVNTYTIGFQEDGYDERPWAKAVAQLYGTVHHERTVQAEDVASVFDRLLWHYDEPFNDYSYLPTFYLCREARKSITVALSGDGGDEMFAGYVKYQRLGMRQDIERFVPRPVARRLFHGAHALVPEANRWHRTLAQYGMDTADMMTDMLTTGMPLNRLRSVARGPLAQALKHYAPAETIRPLLLKASPERVGLINAMRYVDLKMTLAGDILVKVDRASMAVSLEVRPVYLHRDLVALAAKIPPHLLADRHQAKSVLKSALRAWLPDSVLYRPKQGFAMPLKRWMDGDLGQLFGRGPSENPVDHILDSAQLMADLLAGVSRGADGTAQIHSLYVLKHWLAKWA